MGPRYPYSSYCAHSLVVVCRSARQQWPRCAMVHSGLRKDMERQVKVSKKVIQDRGTRGLDQCWLCDETDD